MLSACSRKATRHFKTGSRQDTFSNLQVNVQGFRARVTIPLKYSTVYLRGAERGDLTIAGAGRGKMQGGWIQHLGSEVMRLQEGFS